MMHAAVTGESPKHINAILTPECVDSRPETSSLDRLVDDVPRCENLYRKAFSDAGPRARNELPAALRLIIETSTFKRKLKIDLWALAYK